MAIKDRIIKKTAKTTTVPSTKRKTKLRSGIDVLDFFEINKEISGMFIYDNNKIYLEKNGEISLADEVFDISISDLIRIIIYKYENDLISVGDSYIIKTESGTVINIVSKPYLKSGNFISFKKKKMYDYSLDYFLKHQTISQEISDFLKQKLLSGENIFVAGSFDTNKLPILSYLSELNSENTAILQGMNEILTNSQNNLDFSKSSLSSKELISKAFSLSHNLIVSECEDLEELMCVLEFINSGYKHFITGINISSKEEFINSIKNNIILNYPQMSEEKIITLITSTIKTVVFIEKMKDGETRISNVSEIEVINAEPKVKDIFEFDFGKFTFVKIKSNTKEDTEKPVKKTKRVVLTKKIKKAKPPKQPEPEVKTEAEVKTKPKVKPEPEVKTEAEVKTEPKVKSEPEIKTESKVKSEPKIKSEPEIKTEPKIKTEPEEFTPEKLPIFQPTPEKEVVIQSTIPESAREPMMQLSQKVNKYKLLKEKIKQKREQKV